MVYENNLGSDNKTERRGGEEEENLKIQFSWLQLISRLIHFPQ
jgi:hypothetical protein